MAWQGPQSVARGLRSIPFRQQWELAQRYQQRSPISRFLTPQNCQCRSFSKSKSLKDIVPQPVAISASAPQPARILPASPAYFTGTPRFTDQYLALEDIQARYAHLPTVPHNEAPRMAWLKLQEFREKIGETVPTSRYRRVLKILVRLNQINRAVAPREVVETMEKFLRKGNPYQQQRTPPTLDEMGRARGIGRRKTSSAQVWLVEGDGQVMINGRNVIDVFPRIHDRESALWPLRSTSRLDKYNVFAMVKGGGVTGQAEAMTIALARALLVHEPAMKTILRRAGVIKMDPRQVERKKHGHVKARKKPAWVRR